MGGSSDGWEILPCFPGWRYFNYFQIMCGNNRRISESQKRWKFPVPRNASTLAVYFLLRLQWRASGNCCFFCFLRFFSAPVIKNLKIHLLGQCFGTWTCARLASVHSFIGRNWENLNDWSFYLNEAIPNKKGHEHKNSTKWHPSPASFVYLLVQSWPSC